MQDSSYSYASMDQQLKSYLN